MSSRNLMLISRSRCEQVRPIVVRKAHLAEELRMRRSSRRELRDMNLGKLEVRLRSGGFGASVTSGRLLNSSRLGCQAIELPSAIYVDAEHDRAH